MENVVKKISAIISIFTITTLSLLISSCSENKNAEFLESAKKTRDALRQKKIKAEVIEYEYSTISNNNIKKHAIVIFRYPADDNLILKCYDPLGSYGIIYQEEDWSEEMNAQKIAKFSEKARGNFDRVVISATLLKP